MTRDEQLVQNADLRARIVGWLGANPGPHVNGEVAEGIGEPADRARNALAKLVDDGMVKADGAGKGRGAKIHYAALNTPPSEARAPLVTAKGAKGAKRTPSEGVEIEVNGALITVQRVGGRMRITIGEVK